MSSWMSSWKMRWMPRPTVRWLAVASLALACQHRDSSAPTVPSEMLDGRSPAPAGGSAATPTPTPAPAPTPAVAAPTPLAPEAACQRFAALLAEGCAWAQRFPPEFREKATCLRSLEVWFSPSTAEHEKLERGVGCWARDCDDAAACMVSVQSTAKPPASRRCGEDGTGPVVVDAAAWAARRGAGVRRFSEVTTTTEEPVEVCGIEGEVEWMTRVACNDGSHPYRTAEAANDSRDGWMAHGGRCNSILDRYSVRCPEATYQVHVDRYVCPREP
jgi:hypothetical protein